MRKPSMTAVKRLFTARFKLGMFDPPEMVPYAQIPIEVNDCQAHRDLALKMAQESIVLLKNADGLLPLSKDIKSIAVIGPNADDPVVLLSNYNGMPSSSVTPLQGIKNKVGATAQVSYAKGCEIRINKTMDLMKRSPLLSKLTSSSPLWVFPNLWRAKKGRRKVSQRVMRSTGDREDISSARCAGSIVESRSRNW